MLFRKKKTYFISSYSKAKRIVNKNFSFPVAKLVTFTGYHIV